MNSIDNTLHLGIQEAGDLILKCALAGTNIAWLLLGEPGIAKTAITKWVSSQLPTHEYAYFDIPSTDISDVAIPNTDKDEGFSTMYPNKLHGLHEFTPKVFCLDEYAKGSKQTKDQFHPLFNEGRIGSIKIHPDSIVIATGNLTSDGVGDIIGGQTINRIVTIYVRKPTPEEFCEYGINNGVNTSIMAFTHHDTRALASYVGMADPSENELVYHPKRNNNTALGYMSPRSLVKAGTVIDVFENLEPCPSDSKEMKLRDKQLRASIQGTVGAAGASALMAFLKFAEVIPTPREILAAPKTAVVPPKNGAQMMVAVSAMTWAGKEWVEDGNVVAGMRETLTAWWEYMYKGDKDPRNLSMETIQVFKQLIEARANTGDLEADKIKSCMFSLPKFMEYSNNNMHLTQRSS